MPKKIRGVKLIFWGRGGSGEGGEREGERVDSGREGNEEEEEEEEEEEGLLGSKRWRRRSSTWSSLRSGGRNALRLARSPSLIESHHLKQNIIIITTIIQGQGGMLLLQYYIYIYI